jgi:hypothetical protein
MNPVTGRFMSRDPKEYKPLRSRSKPFDSKKLHKYLYAGGDPVNMIDPRGRDALGEEDEEESEPLLSEEVGVRAVGNATERGIFCAGFVTAVSLSALLT